MVLINASGSFNEATAVVLLLVTFALITAAIVKIIIMSIRRKPPKLSDSPSSGNSGGKEHIGIPENNVVVFVAWNPTSQMYISCPLCGAENETHAVVCEVCNSQLTNR